MHFTQFVALYDKTPPDERWELIDGEAIKMAPASTTHIRIAGAIKELLNARLRAIRPEWFADTEHGARDRSIDSYAPQPDVLVSNLDYPDGQVWTQTFFFVAEVLSNDRAMVLEKKRMFYMSHQHCRAFMFVSQTAMTAELVTRTPIGWQSRSLGPDDAIDIPDIGVIGRLADAYTTSKLALRR